MSPLSFLLRALAVLARGDLIGGDFEVIELLGRGGMGEVYLARQRTTHTLRAVKVLLADRQWDPDLRLRFDREARSTGRIASEHVVEMVSSGVDRARHVPWLAMEYLEGESLGSAVQRFGVPPEPYAKELLLQLFHGVAAAHEAEITHRDLKPENIFLARSRRADVPFTLKVLDFGIARFGVGRSQTEALGTRHWCAPEQLVRGHVGPSADVWALGAIVFWLLTGERYFADQSDDLSVPASARARALGRKLESPAFDAWFARCMQPAPADRYADARVCWRALLEAWPELGGFDGGPAWHDVAERLVVRVHEDEPTGLVASKADPASDEPLAVSELRARCPRVFHVPRPSRCFVGRSEELGWLRAELLRGDVRVAAGVEGLPGIGKTELALQLAHQLAQEGAFPGGILWFAAEHGDLTRTWASDEIAGALGVTAAGVRERARAAVRAVSSSPLPVLVILDNVETWTDSVQPGPLPTGIHVSVLITTRGHRVGGGRFRSLSIGFLPPPEARALLDETAGPSAASRPGFEALLDHLGGYTLAVELAGAYLAEYPDVTPLEYLDRVRAGEPETHVVELTRYERTLQQTLRELWERLDEQVRTAWLLAAQFAPELVSVALSDAVGLGSELRRHLRRLHLIESDDRGNWRMHRLVRAFALGAADAEAAEQATSAFLAGAHARLLGLELATGYQVYGPDRAHFDGAVTLAKARPYEEALGEMVASIASGLHSLGEYEAAKEMFEWALAGDVECLGEDHAKVATLRSNLALLLQDLGELDRAQEELGQALASDLRSRPDDAYKILLRRSNLARLQQDLGECSLARDTLQHGIEVALPLLGEEHVMIAIARSNLSAILCELGELDRALEVVVQALSSDRARLGDDHPYVAVRRFRLGVVLSARGDWAGAEQELREALRIERDTVGSEHPRLALVRAQLSVVLERRGELDQAETEAREALRVVEGQRAGSRFRVGVERLLGASPSG